MHGSAVGSWCSLRVAHTGSSEGPQRVVPLPTVHHAVCVHPTSLATAVLSGLPGAERLPFGGALLLAPADERHLPLCEVDMLGGGERSALPLYELPVILEAAILQLQPLTVFVSCSEVALRLRLFDCQNRCLLRPGFSFLPTVYVFTAAAVLFNGSPGRQHAASTPPPQLA